MIEFRLHLRLVVREQPFPHVLAKHLCPVHFRVYVCADLMSRRLTHNSLLPVNPEIV